MRYRVEIIYYDDVCDVVHYNKYSKVVNTIKILNSIPIYKDIRVYKLIGQYNKDEII